jgi:hypothetical protein
MAGITHRYTLLNSESYQNWTAEIQDWGSLYMLVIWLPNGHQYADWWCKSLLSAKQLFAREMREKDNPKAKWSK